MQRRMKCSKCGLTLRLACLPWTGATWVHAPGDRLRHDRAVAAAERRAQEEAHRAERRAQRQQEQRT
jgi:hypothetical protein